MNPPRSANLSSSPLAIDGILVPQGAEYQAVCRGLAAVPGVQIPVIPLGIGRSGVTQALENPQVQQTLGTWRRAVVMGLAGSLSPDLGVGDLVLYGAVCWASGDPGTFSGNAPGDDRSQPPTLPPSPGFDSWPCPAPWLDSLAQALAPTWPHLQPTLGLSQDSLVSRAAEKQSLGARSGAKAVDMEALPLIQSLRGYELTWATLRVISDDCHTTLPDLAPAIRPDGSLDSFKLALALGQNPWAAFQLIRGSLKALGVLQQVAKALAIAMI